MILLRSLSILLIIGLTSGCAALDVFAAPGSGLTPTETPHPTSTIVWFPPSATPTPRIPASKTPTPLMNPGIGDILFSDNFRFGGLWTTSVSDEGSASVDQNRLTIAAQPGIYMLSLRNDVILSNFYAEITAQVSLCRGEDEYGFLFRANAVAYYRFVINCNGQIRAERVSGNERHPLHPSVKSADAPLDAPGQIRIGVWALGNEMRFFLNDRYQFSITDANYPGGTIGVFARAAADTPVTVNFTDLVVRELEIAPPTRTPVP
jgi:hypothetical protein